MRGPQGGNDVLLPLLREHGLEPQFGHAFLATGRAERGIRPRPSEIRAGPLRVPGAALIVSDATGARFEQRIPNRGQRLARNEDDELAVQGSVSICAFCSLPL